MRVLGVDFGRRRIGLALSDETGVLARPWRTIPAGRTPGASARIVADALAVGGDEADCVGAAVVGLPRKLGGEDTDQTAAARTFAGALERLLELPVHLQDERLTSHEAEARLAEQEPDWRKRKARLDAAAAAVILQEFLDRGASGVAGSTGELD
jgi:putative Holliday junction resolvase